jgi:hypothetical protein
MALYSLENNHRVLYDSHLNLTVAQMSSYLMTVTARSYIEQKLTFAAAGSAERRRRRQHPTVLSITQRSYAPARRRRREHRGELDHGDVGDGHAERHARDLAWNI